jgi:hypothetical protein
MKNPFLQEEESDGSPSLRGKPIEKTSSHLYEDAQAQMLVIAIAVGLSH